MTTKIDDRTASWYAWVVSGIGAFIGSLITLAAGGWTYDERFGGYITTIVLYLGIAIFPIFCVSFVSKRIGAVVLWVAAVAAYVYWCVALWMTCTDCSLLKKPLVLGLAAINPFVLPLLFSAFLLTVALRWNSNES